MICQSTASPHFPQLQQPLASLLDWRVFTLCRFLKDDTHILYPFGYGLSYTTFSYSNLQLLNPGAEGCSNPGELPAVCVLLTVTNTGSTGFKKPAEHVVPLYLTHTALAVSGVAH